MLRSRAYTGRCSVHISKYIVTLQLHMAPYSPQMVQHLFVDVLIMAILTAVRWFR